MSKNSSTNSKSASGAAAKYKGKLMPTGVKSKKRRTFGSKISNVCVPKLKASKLQVPDRFSIKEKFPPVYKQLYGSCTSNAVMGCEDYLYHGNGKWKPSTTFTYYNQLSVEDPPMFDDGSTVEIGLKITKKYGACRTITWPNSKPFDQKPNDRAYFEAGKGKKIKKWYEVKNVTELKQALVSGYPVAGVIYWKSYCFDNYDPSTHIVHTAETASEVEDANGHAVVFVGYDDNTQLVEIRNSWGEEWCNNGYCYMKYSCLDFCIDWTDTYAVVE